MMLYLYAGLGIGAVFLGLLGWGTYEKRRADSAVAVANQWKDAAELAQKERDSARTELNQKIQEAHVTYTKDLKGVTDDYEKRIAHIKSTGHSGLLFDSSGCSSSTKQGDSSPNPTGVTTAARIELPVEIGQNLRQLAKDANTEVVQRNEAVTLLLACYNAAQAP